MDSRRRSDAPRRSHVVRQSIRRRPLRHRRDRVADRRRDRPRRRNAPSRHDAVPPDRVPFQLLPLPPRRDRTAGAGRGGGDRSGVRRSDPRSRTLLGERAADSRRAAPSAGEARSGSGEPAGGVRARTPRRCDVSGRASLLPPVSPRVSPQARTASPSRFRADASLRRPRRRRPLHREPGRGARRDEGARLPGLRSRRTRRPARRFRGGDRHRRAARRGAGQHRLRFPRSRDPRTAPFRPDSALLLHSRPRRGPHPLLSSLPQRRESSREDFRPESVPVPGRHRRLAAGAGGVRARRPPSHPRGRPVADPRGNACRGGRSRGPRETVPARRTGRRRVGPPG